MIENTAKAAISTATIVEPTGVPAVIEISIPNSAQNTDSKAEHIVTDLKLLNTRMAESAGNMTSAEIKSEPTRFMARTIITAVVTAIIRLYSPALTPDALANVSSNVTEKILL